MKKALKFIGKSLLVLICLILLFMLGLFIYHRIMLGKEKELISQPLGKMVEVDGGQMCVYSKGSGDHTIVFMSGYGTPSPILDFKPLYDKLSGDFRIAVVEKFGYGFSDETTLPRDVDTMLGNTREALSKAGIEGPYILCPHSASGIEAVYWAQKYPDEVEGITAIDVAIPGYHEESGDSIFADKLAAFWVNSGLTRITPKDSWDYAFNSPYLTDSEKEQYLAILYAKRGSKTMLHEAEWCKRNMDTLLKNDPPSVPMLFFVSQKMAAEVFPSDPEKYLLLPQKYTNGRAETEVLDCGHYIHLEEPELIAAEIRKFADKL